MDWFKYVTRALQVMGLMTATLPEILADGKITVKEITDVFVRMAQICHWDIEIDVPSGVQNQVLGVKG